MIDLIILRESELSDLPMDSVSNLKHTKKKILNWMQRKYLPCQMFLVCAMWDRQSAASLNSLQVLLPPKVENDDDNHRLVKSLYNWVIYA